MAGTSRRLPAHAALWVVLALLCFAGVSRSLWTPDEPREAEIAKEMYVRPGIIPELNGTPFYEKPPLYYWIVAAAYRLAGSATPVAARAVSGTAGILTLIALFLWAERAHSARAGVTACLVLATSGVFLVSTHWVRLDSVLALFTTVAFWAAWEAVERGGNLALAALYSGLFLGLWTKGFVGPVVAGAGLAAWCVVDRERGIWRRLRPALGSGVLLLSAVALGGAFYLEGGSEALWQWGWVNHVRRFLDPGSKGHAKPVYSYLVEYMPLALFPWLAPAAALLVPSFWKAGGSEGRLRRYCGSVVGAGILVLSASSSKRQIYLLPLMAPACLLLALAALERIDGRRGEKRAGAGTGPLLWANTLLVGIAGLAPAAVLAARERSLSASMALSLVLALAAAGAGVVFLLRSDARRAFACSMASAVVGAGSALLLLMPAFEAQKDLGPVISWIDGRIAPGEPVYAVGSDETLRGIVPFVTGRTVIEVEPGDLGKKAGGRPDPPPFLVYQQIRTDRVPAEIGCCYARLGGSDVGPGRRISLWRLTPG